MQQLTLFAPPLGNLLLEPTPAMLAGVQRAYQCSWCGSVLVVPSASAPAYPCSSCGRQTGWWEQRFPVAGLDLLTDSTWEALTS